MAEEAEENRKRMEQILNDIGTFKEADKDTVFFGAYPQSLKDSSVEIVDLMDKEFNYYLGNDNCLYKEFDGDYYKVEAIKWKVLSRGLSFARKYFVVSDLILDAHRFHESSNNYADSEIRNWLNGEFYYIAFRDEQKSKIETTTVDNSRVSTGGTSNKYICDNTNDKVFLLSYQETKKYLGSNESRKRVPTDYAVARGVFHSTGSIGKYRLNGKSCSLWWLRSPDSYRAQSVDSDGSFRRDEVDFTSNGVVPALKFNP